jgi:SNF2 family DNA or RNA helicase
MLSREDLHPYQLRAIEYIKDKKRCGLALAMGLGKTVASLTAVNDLLDGFVATKVLVIAPLRVAKSVWPKEVTRWSHLSHLKVSVCLGTERQRLAALQTTADIYTINRENVPWLVTQYRGKWPFDCVIIDESSSFKNSSSLRWKALRRTLPETYHMILLTGTPSPNGLLDVWSQQYLIDYGMSLGRTMTGYKQRFFEADYMGYKWTLKGGAAEEIQQLMGSSWLSMSADDYLELPERIDLVESIALPESIKHEYDQFEKTLLADLPDGDVVEAVNAGALATKLLQWCNGALYTGEHKNWALIHDAKIDALAAIVEDNDEPMLVAYNFKSDLERLQKAFPNAAVLDKDPATIDRWNRGEIKMLLAHPQSAGHGLNLQDGGALCVWFGLSWSLEAYLQFNARLHRQGQTRPVRIIHLIAQGCLDERVMSVLQDKDSQQKSLLMALKSHH